MTGSVPNLICSEVRVRNLPRAVRFYRALGLGPVTKGRMNDGTKFVWVRDPKTRQLLELYYLPPRSRLYRPFRARDRLDPQPMFGVQHAKPLLARLRRLGASVVTDFQEGNFRLTLVRDPDGTCLELVSWTTEARKTHRDPPLLGLVLARKRRPSRPR